MLIITKDLTPYKIASYTDNFVVVHTGRYFKTFKKDEIDTVFVGPNEEVPDCLMNKIVTTGEWNGREYTRSHKKRR